MAKRKTVNVEALLDEFNTILASELVPNEVKVGVCTAAERLLFAADRYAGWGYNHMTYNVATERYDVDPDTEFCRTYFVKGIK